MDRDTAIAALAAQQHGVFSVVQAKSNGFSTKAIRVRVARCQWTSPKPGVLVVAGTPRTFEQRVMIGVLSLGPHAVASHRSAGALYELIEDRRAIVDVTLPHGHQRRRRTGIVLHQATLQMSDVRTMHGIPVTGQHRTLVDLASDLPKQQLERVLDDAILKRLFTPDNLLDYVVARRLRNRPGMGVLWGLLVDRTVGVPESELERLFERKLRRAALPIPVRQFEIGRRRVDFAYPDLRIAIELDGFAYHASAAALDRDARRKTELAMLGWLLVHFTWGQVRDDWDHVERSIRQALSSREALGAL